MIYFNIYGVALSKPINEIDYISLNPSYESMWCYHRKEDPPIVIETPTPKEMPQPFGPPSIKEDSPIVQAPKPRKKVKSSLDFNLK
jgi:hypothetical protein